jgi:hypothetical protein
MTKDEPAKLPTNLEELYAKQIEFCRKIFDECGEVQPMWVGQSNDNELYPISAVFGSPEEKEEIGETLRAIFKRFDVIRYVSMLDSWMVISEKDKYVPGTRPSEHPDRIEVILITGEDGENEIFGYFRIIRGEEGEKPRLSEFKRNNGSGFMSLGTFSALLPRQNNREASSLH